MLEYIKGKIVEKGEDFVIVEVGSIGFFIYTPSDFDVGFSEQIFVKMFIKEESPVMYGFRTREERDLFVQLLSVSGVGVKHALSILGRYSVGEILDILEESDVDALTDVPGIGKKTAQRIILELRGKIDFIKNELVEDVVSALLSLGFEKKDAFFAAKEAVKETKDLEEAVKKALQKITEKR
ncbi:Holliday junction branch migration protein RuvA [Persephonella atlantica]|uniref:Holliday junction branch migration complex subunit RuvA n=1 Tax=Persephonella atlantica TaxID=2699429 RepID=A0ABS1GFX9_9AQUI|nr:Holliday junction branch migration protein RuvA [Persephonella atlantica]MBK3331831.1 Holliday junction branch migration protein RuvA [Persephonella atlantica]